MDEIARPATDAPSGTTPKNDGAQSLRRYAARTGEVPRPPLDTSSGRTSAVTQVNLRRRFCGWGAVMERTAIISVDGHVKASRAGYRDYIQAKYLDAYDEKVKAIEATGLPDAGNMNPAIGLEVQWDSQLRMKNLESIGVVAEVLFPNGVPFQENPFDDFARGGNRELLARAVGRTTGGWSTSAPRCRSVARARCRWTSATSTRPWRTSTGPRSTGSAASASPGSTPATRSSSTRCWIRSGRRSRRPACR